MTDERKGQEMTSKAFTQGRAIMRDEEVREWIGFACDCNGCPELVDRIYFDWSNRMTRAMGKAGRAGYVERNGSAVRMWKIKLSVGLFGNAGRDDRYETIVHEVCHVIDDYLHNGWERIEDGHGPRWRAIMRKCGIAPRRYHNVSREGLVKRHLYTCDCGNEFKLSTRMHNSVRRGRRRTCRRCRGYIKYTGKIV